jgi:cytochrome c553
VHAKGSNVRSVLIIVAAVALLPMATPVAGQAVSTVARSLAAGCANCHGTNGISAGELFSLAGRPKDEIARKMQDFKAGRVSGTIMPQLAKGYTDEQIDLVAEWFAAQRAK